MPGGRGHWEETGPSPRSEEQFEGRDKNGATRRIRRKRHKKMFCNGGLCEQARSEGDKDTRCFEHVSVLKKKVNVFARGGQQRRGGGEKDLTEEKKKVGRRLESGTSLGSIRKRIRTMKRRTRADKT